MKETKAAIDGGRRLLTLAQVSDFLQMSRRHVYRLIDTESLPAFKVGDHWRVEPEELDAWIDKWKASGRSRKP
jgi:excisionase family DNA binding protein